jgi:hypothetical protein
VCFDGLDGRGGQTTTCSLSVPYSLFAGKPAPSESIGRITALSHVIDHASVWFDLIQWAPVVALET